MQLETLDPKMFLTFGKFNGHHITNIPAQYREWLLAQQWLDDDIHESIFNLSERDEIITEIRPTVRPVKVKLSKSDKKAAARKAMAAFVVPPPNTQKQVFIRDWRSHPYEVGDPF